MTANREYEEGIAEEVAKWGGASVEFGMRSKHCEAVISVGDESMFVTFPSSPSDGKRGLLNCLTDVRNALRDLGAAPPAKVKAAPRTTGPQNNGREAREIAVGELASVRPEPFAPLARVPLITEPGIYPGITPAQYFAEPCPDDALTNSRIGILIGNMKRKGGTPAHLAYELARGQFKDAGGRDDAGTAAQRNGQIVHRLALGKGADYVVSPHAEYRTNEAKAWRDGIIASGRMPVKEKDLAAAQGQADIIADQIREAVRGEEYQTEVVIAWKRSERWCRAMIDVWCPALGLALDVKTARDASDEAVAMAFARGYARQDAWYRSGLDALGLGASFGFLFVESDPPHLGRFAECSEGFRHMAQDECDRAFAMFDAAMTREEWPGYKPIKVLPPNWAVRQYEEMMMEDEA